MTTPTPKATTPTRRDRTAQSVFAPRQADHAASPGPSTAKTAGPAQPASSARSASGPLLLTVTQAAQRLGISRSLLYELLATGDSESITTYIHAQRATHQGRQT
jgi:AraC-like DNA-binding protein